MNKGVLAGLGPGDSPDVVSSDAGQNAIITAGNRKEISFSLGANGGSAPIDCSNYRYISVQITAIGATVVPQGSNDGVNWVTLPLNALAFALGSVVLPVTFLLSGGGSLGVYTGVVPTRYFRLNVSSFSTAVTGVIELFTNPLVPPVSNTLAVVMGGGGSNVSTQNTIANTLGDGTSNNPGGGYVASVPYVYTGTANWDRQRGPAIFKTVSATASGNTALWTPTSGKKFRIMRYRLEVTSDAATSGGTDLIIKFQDATTDTALFHSVFVPATAGTTMGPGYNSDWTDLGNGILSAAANNVLNVNLSAALTSGVCRVLCAGTEE